MTRRGCINGVNRREAYFPALDGMKLCAAEPSDVHCWVSNLNLEYYNPSTMQMSRIPATFPVMRPEDSRSCTLYKSRLKAAALWQHSTWRRSACGSVFSKPKVHHKDAMPGRQGSGNYEKDDPAKPRLFGGSRDKLPCGSRNVRRLRLRLETTENSPKEATLETD